jgi:hypothetical protein
MQSNGIVFWRGNSLLDGGPVVAIATRKTRNPKTGKMWQTWILRSDISPMEAIQSGADVSICGDCPLRGKCGKKRACYVNVWQAPTAVWNAYQRGAYRASFPDETAAAFAGQQVRLGAYGDPAAIPLDVWRSALSRASDWSGYTHQWRNHTALSEFCMASVDSHDEAVCARPMGWRTFRVGAGRCSLEKPCPAGPKASLVQCATCPVKCNGGNDGPSIVIAPHGKGSSCHPSQA